MQRWNKWKGKIGNSKTEQETKVINRRAQSTNKEYPAKSDRQEKLRMNVKYQAENLKKNLGTLRMGSTVTKQFFELSLTHEERSCVIITKGGNALDAYGASASSL